MITITRRQARCLRGVLRRHVLGITHRGAIPPLVFRTGEKWLRVQHQDEALAIEHRLPGGQQAEEAVALPLDALAEFEGRDDSAVELAAVSPARTTVRWVDHGVPRSRAFDVPALDGFPPFPDPPSGWMTGPAGLLADLAEACRAAAEGSTRYALNCIQIRGGAGEIAASDGRQLLLRRGLSFPWAEDLLVRRSPVFACRALPRDQPLAIGRTGTHVVLRAGSWTLSLAIQTEGRFPDVRRIIPDPGGAVTRLRIDPEDAAFVLPALDRLPGVDEPYSPATLDLNGQVAIRARGAGQPGMTELVLSRSGYTGTPVRINTDRHFLARALRLGLTTLEMVDADAPVVGRDRDRVFIWQPLSRESALDPGDDVIRIESCFTTNPVSAPGDPSKVRNPMPQPSETPKPDVPSGGVTAGAQAVPESPGPAGLAALIEEAEALHEALSEARARAGRLTAALRRYRRRERLVNSTLASIRALQLQGDAG